jgi:hypothetical protein
MTADSRQQTADSRQQTADSRQQTADSKEHASLPLSDKMHFVFLLTPAIPEKS